MPEHITRNEEDAITQSIEQHHASHGLGDARTMAKAILEGLKAHHTRVAAQQPEPDTKQPEEPPEPTATAEEHQPEATEEHHD